MKLDVVFLPRHLEPPQWQEKAVVVFDVLRATTTMAAALAAGVEEIRVFGELGDAADAARAHDGPHLLCGEHRCLPPEGFDLGNSPGAFTAEAHAGHTMYMCTTNGTRAIMAARQARELLIGALVNASAVAGRLPQLGRDTTLLCAGTDGEIAMEDVLGAGAVIDVLVEQGKGAPVTDTARVALRLFRGVRNDLAGVLRAAQGGRNVVAAGLAEDVDFAARLNMLDVVGVVRDEPLRVIATRCP